MSFRQNTSRKIFLAFLNLIYISSLKKLTVFQDLALAINVLYSTISRKREHFYTVTDASFSSTFQTLRQVNFEQIVIKKVKICQDNLIFKGIQNSTLLKVLLTILEVSSNDTYQKVSSVNKCIIKSSKLVAFQHSKYLLNCIVYIIICYKSRN